MPAFQLKQFQRQLEQLLQLFALPTDFHQKLTAVFQRYEQPSYRYGAGVTPLPEPAYHIQPVMLEKMVAALKDLAADRPRPAVLLAQECWQDDYYEVKYLAAVILGQAPLFDLPFFLDTYQTMLESTSEKEYLDLLFIYGMGRFRAEKFPQLIEMIEDWLESESDVERDHAFSAIQSLVDSHQLAYLPTVFRLIEKYVIEGNIAYREYVLQIIDSLVELSPMETAHFLSELTNHFYGEERMRYFRMLCRSFDRKERDFIYRSFMGNEPMYYEEDVIDD